MRSVLVRSLFAVTALVTAAVSVAASVLIVPEKPAKHTYADMNGNLLELIAGKINEDGRINPIAWSITDIIFRTARDNGQIPRADLPSLEMATQAANTLRCEYILFVSIWRDGKDMYSRTRLLHKGKQVWLDPNPDPKFVELMRENAKNDPEKKPFDEEKVTYNRLTVEVSAEESTFDLLASIAQTWTEKLFVEPFKDMKPRPRGQAPAVEGGVDPIPTPPTPDKGSNQELLAKVMALLAKGDRAGAVTTMRDAVDTSPLDAERRKYLVDVLMTSGYYAEAAKQARRAALILDKPSDMFVAAAKAWLAVDNLEEAQKDLKEAVAREPDSPAVRGLIGEVALRDSRYDEAIKHFTASIDRQEDAGVYFNRALAHALLGEGGKARSDLEKAKTLGLNETSSAALYGSSIGFVSTAAIKAGSDLRDLVQKIRVRPYDKGMADELDLVRVKIDALSLFLKELSAPKTNEKSHGERALGLKLMIEAIVMVESYLKVVDEDVIAEAQISLGEGLRRLLDARDSYAKEISQ